MHNQNKIPTDYRSLLSLTSLTAAEFFHLLEAFDELWQRYHAHRYLKGGHTYKNLLVSKQHNQILYLSPTVAGSMHDKVLADEVELEFLPQQSLLLDLGLVGYQPEGAHTVLPFKKPAKGELSEHDKLYNRLLASIRVKVEHVMAGVKRIRIVKDKIRLKREFVIDQLMLIACGLHNLRIQHRNLS